MPLDKFVSFVDLKNLATSRLSVGLRGADAIVLIVFPLIVVVQVAVISLFSLKLSRDE